MKNFILFLLMVLIGASSVQAQSMVEDGNRWIVGWFSVQPSIMPGGTLSHETLYEIPQINADTIVANYNYKKLYKDENLIGCLREDLDSVIYFLPKDLLIESVLYDFSVKTGDTIQTYPAIGLDILVDTVVPGYVEIIELPFGQNCSWYYNIGSPGGLFHVCATTVGTGYAQLTCMSDTNAIRWGSNGTSARCEKTLVGLSSIKNTSVQITIHPNPVKNILYLNTEGETSHQLEIVNALGQTILEQEIISSLTLDVSSWQRGIYFLKCNGTIQKFILN